MMFPLRILVKDAVILLKETLFGVTARIIFPLYLLHILSEPGAHTERAPVLIVLSEASLS